MSAKPHGTFITDNGNRKVHVFEIPDDELDEVLARLAIQLQEALDKFEEEEAAKPGFINDQRK